MGESGAADEVAQAVAAELRLMEPSVRSSRAQARELLDPDFVEVGASGRRWTYEEMLAALPELPGGAEDGPRYEPSAMAGTVLAPGLVHLTYETRIDGLHARRSSLWRRHPDGSGWRMYYHQATPVPPQP
ncbi:nuclear transport factor 2 family protein [Streptomyces vilmorinianum]|uniref:nuclear transport factor 2 family protein n=1 Tax=Streptomyces vilmorinianum TaxID=3051092 RepID=UPI0024E0D4E5|nr:nuclear transport factor 2 family protein [Streptomyces vilmorinianum]